MKKLTDVFETTPQTFSFELFPPKTEKGYQNLLKTISALKALSPDFISVTYGAGGGSRAKTLDIVDHVQKDHNILAVAHLTCVLHTKEEIKSILDSIKALGVRNILALGGDTPKDQPDWKPGKDNFHYSSELCEFIRLHYSDLFALGVAGFPEGHTLSPDRETDAKYLKSKIDAGADYVITQLFFDNKEYFDYVNRLKTLGVTKRIIPGILPITDYNGIVRFCATCGASVPPKVHEVFEPIKDNKEAMVKAGTEFAIAQCRELLTGGAPGIHFYCLNKIHPVDSILPEIRT